MAAPTNSFEGGTSGVTVTTANSGAASGTAFDALNVGTGTTVAYDSTFAAVGTKSLKLATGTTAAAADVEWTTAVGSASQVWGRLYLYVTANPAASFRVFTAATSGGAALVSAVYLMTDGTVMMINSAGSTIIQTTTPVTLNAWNRVEFMVISSATVGQVEVKLFTSPGSTTAADTKTSAANLNTSAGPIALYSFGTGFDTKASIGPYWLDEVGISTVGYLGPVASAALPRIPRRSPVPMMRAANF